MIPRSATPSPTNSTTSDVRTKRMSRSKFWTRAIEAPVVLLEDEARVVEQGEGRLDQPSLVRNGEPHSVAHQRSSPAVG